MLTSGSSQGGLLELGISLVMQDRFSNPAREASSELRRLHQEAKMAVEANLQAAEQWGNGIAQAGKQMFNVMGQALDEGLAYSDTMITVQAITEATADQMKDAAFAESCLPFVGEIYMGHLRYSTTGKSGLSYVHPFLRRNNWRAKNLALCGNFNLTNVDEIFQEITSKGQHPRIYSDTYIMLEQVGHRLDRESERLFQEALEKGMSGMDITSYIEEHIDVNNVLRTSSPFWDGGYVVCGLTGSGEMFAMRDPWGIRPAFWYKDDEVLVPDPSYPSNFLNAELLGGKTVRVPLKADDNYRIDIDAFESAVSEHTKMVLLTNPNNPTTTVFLREDLEKLAAFIVKHDLVCVADQAFESTIFDGREKYL